MYNDVYVCIYIYNAHILPKPPREIEHDRTNSSRMVHMFFPVYFVLVSKCPMVLRVAVCTHTRLQQGKGVSESAEYICVCEPLVSQDFHKTFTRLQTSSNYVINVVFGTLDLTPLHSPAPIFQLWLWNG